MPFCISTETADELTLTFQPVSRGCVRAIIGTFGGLAVLVGGGLLALHHRAGADFLNLLALTFVVMGTGFALLGIFLTNSGNDDPTALVFDRRLGAVRVCQWPAPEAYLRYADIDHGEVETRSHSHSGSGRRSSSTTYTFHAVLCLRDGGRWCLTQDATRAAADAQLARLTEALRPGAAAGAALPPPVLPPQVTLTQTATSTALRWDNPVTGREAAGKVAALAFFGTVLALFGAIAYSQRMPVFAYGVLGFIGVVFGAVAVSSIRRLYKDAHYRYALVFDGREVTYCEEARATGRETHRQTVPLPDWYGLSYSYDAMSPANETVLLLSREAHQQYLQQQQARSLGSALNTLLEKDLSRALYFKQFSVPQRLAVVNWARAEADRRLAAG